MYKLHQVKRVLIFFCSQVIGGYNQFDTYFAIVFSETSIK